MSDERAANIKDKKIGQRVRTRRLNIGMSQEKLAELLGLTFQQVQKYEKGANRIAASRLHDIATALEMPVAEFFEGLDGKTKSAVEEPSGPPTAQEAKLIARLCSRKVSKLTREKVFRLIEVLVEEDLKGKK